MTDTEAALNAQKAGRDFWIEKCFNKRECIKFLRTGGNGSAERDRCICGFHKLLHNQEALDVTLAAGEGWSAQRDTKTLPTDAFGQIDFQGACHASKAQYVRLDYLTSAERILQLLLHHWQLELPKLLISVHGGIANFDLQPKLNRVFNKGLIKAANTTGAWIITGGTNTGVMRHVGAALAEKSIKTRKKHIVAIGIAPWGVVHKRKDLIGKDCSVDYHAAAHPTTNTAVLNSSHNYFLLADNGTEGKYGADFMLRKKLERYISRQRIHIRGEKPLRGHGVPIVCLVLEGGSNTIRTVLDYLMGEPAVPVVVCDGSGRAADLIAFCHKFSNDDGILPDPVKEQLLTTIKKTFSYSEEQAERVYYELIMCMKKKHLITVFRMSENCQDIDLPILTALLTGQNTKAPHQLSLALSWDRVDVARSHIFTYGQDWPEGSLEHAMLEALVQNKVDFVELLIEKGVNMQKFLTITNLEELYNTKIGSTSTLHMVLRDIRKKSQPQARVTLIEIGQIIEKLMGGAFRSNYNRRKFKLLYYSQVTRTTFTADHKPMHQPEGSPFPYPYSDLMIWAVLMKRQKMARFFWRGEEEALTKAIVACKLYKALAREAIDEPLVDNEVSEELTTYAKEFQKLALEILDHSYKENDDKAVQLLTYELKSYSNQTCISLAHSANMRDFIAHPCCQNLITDMWMGGLRMNKSSTYKVILGILFPITIVSLDFKSKEELQLLPQTVEEHVAELEDAESDEEEEENEDIDALEGRSIEAEPHPVSRRTSIVQLITRKASLLKRSSRRASTTAKTYHDESAEAKIVTWQPVDQPELDMNGGHYKPPPDQSFFNTSMLKELKKRHRELKLGKKFTEFYGAPVTKFWMHTLAYMVFMCLYNYVVLVKLERNHPSPMELYVIAYIFFHGIEMIREIAVSEPVKFSKKLAVFFGEKWNLMDLISVSMFWVGVSLRFQADEYLFLCGRVLYSVNIIFWYIRILELFAVSKNLGPYVVIIGKLVMDMLNFIVILLIVLMSFGVARQAIRNPYAQPSWNLARNVFLEPYFMLYGEVYAGDIDPPCGPGQDVEVCWPGRWITPAIMSAYLLVANILLLNLLIAVFNNTFQKTSQNSKEIWMFQRYSLTLEYEIKPLLPSPLIVFSFAYLIIKWIIRRCKGKPKIKDYGLKLFLNEDEVKRLHGFEEDCVDDYFNRLELKFESSTEERIRATNQRVENVTMKIDDINQKENQLKLSMQTLEVRIANLEELALSSFDQAQQLHRMTMAALVPGSATPSSYPIAPFSASSSDGNYWDPTSPADNPPTSEPDYEHLRVPRPLRRVPAMKPDETYQPRSSLLRRRKLKEMAPIRTNQSLTSKEGRAFSPPERAKFSLDVMSDSEMSHSLSASAALPSIVETHHTPTEEAPTDASSAPSQLTCPDLLPQTQPIRVTVPSHRVLQAVSSLPVPKRDLDSDSSSSELSPAPPSNVSCSSPRLHSALSIHGSQTVYNHDPMMFAFTPVKPALRNEYTSITDCIDTSCVLNSPNSSPSQSFNAGTGGRFYFGPNMDPADTKRKSSENQFIRDETRQLRRAEETENKVIGKAMKSRIRQISVDDSNSMSNLAQLIMAELSAASPCPIADEHSDTESSLSNTMPESMLKESMREDMDLSQTTHF